MNWLTFLRTRRDVCVAAGITTLLNFAVVGAATAIAYPPDEWIEEILLHGGIAAGLTLIVVLKLFDLIRHNNVLATQLEHRANIDPLTDVATRRLFFERLEKAPGLTGICLMVDIDHFKQVNDVHGHLIGDRVIQRVADSLRACVRDTDIVCRFGGEEFAVFLEGADPDEAEQIAERMRRTVEAGETESREGSVQVTVSIGLSLKPSDADISSSLQKADQALYKAKSTGRNRVVIDFSQISRVLSISVAGQS